MYHALELMELPNGAVKLPRYSAQVCRRRSRSFAGRIPTRSRRWSAGYEPRCAEVSRATRDVRGRKVIAIAAAALASATIAASSNAQAPADDVMYHAQRLEQEMPRDADRRRDRGHGPMRRLAARDAAPRRADRSLARGLLGRRRRLRRHGRGATARRSAGGDQSCRRSFAGRIPTRSRRWSAGYEPRCAEVSRASSRSTASH